MRLTAIVCLLVALLSGVAAADDYVFRATPNIAIPDGPDPGVTTSLQASPNCTITDVNIALEVTHTWVGDLVFRITHGGVTVTIVDRAGFPAGMFGCSNDLDCGDPIVLDDEAANPIEDTCSGGGTFPAGDYRPNNPLSAFDGLDQNGQWDLFVEDQADFDIGTLCAWEVRVTCNAAPVEPTTWGQIKERYSAK